MEVMDQQALAGVMDPGSPRFFFGGGGDGKDKRKGRSRKDLGLTCGMVVKCQSDFKLVEPHQLHSKE